MPLSSKPVVRGFYSLYFAHILCLFIFLFYCSPFTFCLSPAFWLDSSVSSCEKKNIKKKTASVGGPPPYQRFVTSAGSLHRTHPTHTTNHPTIRIAATLPNLTFRPSMNPLSNAHTLLLTTSAPPEEEEYEEEGREEMVPVHHDGPITILPTNHDRPIMILSTNHDRRYGSVANPSLNQSPSSSLTHTQPPSRLASETTTSRVVTDPSPQTTPSTSNVISVQADRLAHSIVEAVLRPVGLTGKMLDENTYDLRVDILMN